LTRKHFVAFAAAINYTMGEPKKGQVGTKIRKSEVVKMVADVLCEFGERFDRDRFYSFCGVTRSQVEGKTL